MREIVAVGRVTDEGMVVVEIAKACAWCTQPLTEEDARRIARGAKVSHGLCTDCADKHFPDPPRVA